MNKAAASIVLGLTALQASQAGVGVDAFWREVDNSVGTYNEQPTGLAASWRTFDLYVTAPVGSRIQAVNMGYAADPTVDSYFLYVDGDIYNDPFVTYGDLPQHEPILTVLPSSAEFDSHVFLHDAAPNSISFVPQSFNFEGPELRGVWYSIPNQPGSPSLVDESGEFRILRLTVSSDTTQLGGNGSAIQLGLRVSGDAQTPDSLIPLALSPFLIVPTPPTAGFIAIAGLMLTRRRR